MVSFGEFKKTLKGALASMKGPGDPVAEFQKAIEAADNWESLERKLVELRAITRKRQQDVLERLEPLAKQIEDLVAKAKEAKIKIMRQNLLRQADGYMRQLEAEDEPAEIYAANALLLTRLITQVQRVRAMKEQQIDAGAIDRITAEIEQTVGEYEESLGAAQELEAAGKISLANEVTAASVEERLSKLYGTEGETIDGVKPGAEAKDIDLDEFEKRLYE